MHFVVVIVKWGHDIDSSCVYVMVTIQARLHGPEWLCLKDTLFLSQDEKVCVGSDVLVAYSTACIRCISLSKVSSAIQDLDHGLMSFEHYFCLVLTNEMAKHKDLSLEHVRICTSCMYAVLNDTFYTLAHVDMYHLFHTFQQLEKYPDDELILAHVAKIIKRVSLTSPRWSSNIISSAKRQVIQIAVSDYHCLILCNNTGVSVRSHVSHGVMDGVAEGDEPATKRHKQMIGDAGNSSDNSSNNSNNSSNNSSNSYSTVVTNMYVMGIAKYGEFGRGKLVDCSEVPVPVYCWNTIDDEVDENDAIVGNRVLDVRICHVAVGLRYSACLSCQGKLC